MYRWRSTTSAADTAYLSRFNCVNTPCAVFFVVSITSIVVAVRVRVRVRVRVKLG